MDFIQKPNTLLLLDEDEGERAPPINDNVDVLLKKRTVQLRHMMYDRGFEMTRLAYISHRNLIDLMVSGQRLRLHWRHVDPEYSTAWTRWHSNQVAQLGPVHMVIPHFAPEKDSEFTVYVHTQQVFHVLNQLDKNTTFECTSVLNFPQWRAFMQRRTNIELVTPQSRPGRRAKELQTTKRNPKTYASKPPPTRHTYASKTTSSAFAQLRRATKAQLSTAIMACPKHVRDVILQRIRD